MADYDDALDAASEVEDFIANQIHKLRANPGNIGTIPGDFQAAYLFTCLVCPTECVTLLLSDRLYALAVDLADSIEGLLIASARADAPPVWPYRGNVQLTGEAVKGFVGKLRAWAVGVARFRDDYIYGDR